MRFADVLNPDSTARMKEIMLSQNLEHRVCWVGNDRLRIEHTSTTCHPAMVLADYPNTGQAYCLCMQGTAVENTEAYKGQGHYFAVRKEEVNPDSGLRKTTVFHTPRNDLPALRMQKILAGEDSWLSMSGLWISSIGKKRNDL